MKTILCYGDSNTWGYNHETQGRFSYGERWPNVMQKHLGDRFRVIEEGLNGRTTAKDDPDDEYPEAKNGQSYLIPCLRSHSPLDLIILMLGTNDLKEKFFTTVDEIADNAGKLVELSRNELCGRQEHEPEILLVAPIAIGSTIETSVFREEFGGRKSIVPSIALADALRRTSERFACRFLNAAQIARPNEGDAIHFSREGHRQFGEAAARKVQEIFGSRNCLPGSVK